MYEYMIVFHVWPMVSSCQCHTNCRYFSLSLSLSLCSIWKTKKYSFLLIHYNEIDSGTRHIQKYTQSDPKQRMKNFSSDKTVFENKLQRLHQWWSWQSIFIADTLFHRLCLHSENIKIYMKHCLNTFWFWFFVRFSADKN